MFACEAQSFKSEGRKKKKKSREEKREEKKFSFFSELMHLLQMKMREREREREEKVAIEYSLKLHFFDFVPSYVVFSFHPFSFAATPT